ncbi:MAG: NAD-dependent epimerase/dehydratase family protein [Coriobacteriia bacterium]|nr:NAD-dependent epimerase/dehydratase family protein [Coriobacteriia bacterium]
MKVLVTGSSGFIGKNLIYTLKALRQTDEELVDLEIIPFDIDDSSEYLSKVTENCDFVFHLAGVNRPETDEEFMDGNFGFTTELVDCLKSANNKSPIVFTSSIQASLDNAYGISKRAGEDYLRLNAQNEGSAAIVYRLPNVFGKWAQPNYNSAIATFCHNVARGKDITVNDSERVMQLVHIDDVVEDFISLLKSRSEWVSGSREVKPILEEKLGIISETIKSFPSLQNTLMIPDVSSELTRKLYSTYLSYVPSEQWAYSLKAHRDARGSFAEVFKSEFAGQVSVNTAAPFEVKGNHWHNSKHEKFLVLSGKARISFRKIGDSTVFDIVVSGDKMEVVDVPPGYTHSIENLLNEDLITLIWVNEIYDPQKSDTFFEEV